MTASLAELADIAGAEYVGDANCIISAVNTLAEAKSGEISFLTNKKYKHHLATTSASAVILSPEFQQYSQLSNLIISDNPYLCYAKIANHLQDRRRQEAGIHDSAIIGDNCKIADTATVSALAFIGDYCEIGEGVFVGPGSVIEHDCYIGNHSDIAANVTIKHGVRIGERCFIQSGAVIGGDGFGFANDQGQWVKIPQTGTVIIGNDVEIGVNTAVDRGAIRDTVIEDGVKLDNLIQIAHNVHIGEHTAMAGLAGIAGSTTIGKHCTIGGAAGVVGHVRLEDNVHVSAMTKVTKSILEAGVYTGNVSAMPHQLWSKNMARFKQLDELTKKIKTLEKKLDEK